MDKPFSETVQTTTLGVAIVNYATPELVIDCLNSIKKTCSQFEQIHVVVVDNCSPDNSVALIDNFITHEGLTNWIKVISAGKNGGFAYGNNVALSELVPLNCDFYWLLNPDTIAHENAAYSLVEHLQKHENVGITGSKQVNAHGEQLSSAFNFPSPLGELLTGAKFGFLDNLLPNRIVPVQKPKNGHSYDWLSGASLMIKSEVINKLDHLDDDYFLYYEEVDYCFQIKRLGYDLHYVDDSVITHFVGSSTDIQNKQKPVPLFWFESRRRFFIKSYGRFWAIIADIFHFIGLLMFTFKRALKRVIGKGIKKNQSNESLPPKYMSTFLKSSSFLKGTQ